MRMPPLHPPYKPSQPIYISVVRSVGIKELVSPDVFKPTKSLIKIYYYHRAGLHFKTEATLVRELAN